MPSNTFTSNHFIKWEGYVSTIEMHFSKIIFWSKIITGKFGTYIFGGRNSNNILPFYHHEVLFKFAL